MIKLGNRVRDIVTDFTGIATGKCEYLNGCIQFCIKSRIKNDEKYPEGHWIDEGQLEYLSEGISSKSKDTGGPMSDTPSGNYGG